MRFEQKLPGDSSGQPCDLRWNEIFMNRPIKYKYQISEYINQQTIRTSKTCYIDAIDKFYIMKTVYRFWYVCGFQVCMNVKLALDRGFFGSHLMISWFSNVCLFPRNKELNNVKLLWPSEAT